MFRPSVIAGAALLSVACAQTAKPPVSASPADGPRVVDPVFVKPSRLFPDLDADSRVHWTDPDGTRRFLTMQMRVIERPDGSMSKAPGLLPAGRFDLLALDMPSRLGGGYLFASASSSWTQLWRAEHWLAPLELLVRLNGRYEELIPGFDRIYLASRRANTPPVAVDPSTGEFRPLGNLPAPAGKGPMIFPDAWRAVVVADFRGPLATFNAGSSWVPLGLRETVESLSLQGDTVLITTHPKRQVHVLDAAGRLSLHSPRAREDVPSDLSPRSSRPRPLRLAIERGVPLDASRVLVAHDGDLLEVSMEDGSILRTMREVLPRRYSECQGIPLGKGVGFVCGVRHGPTVVFAYEAPRTLRPVLTYPDPQAVFSSDNGAVVVRAPCPGGGAVADQIQYCVLNAEGKQREVRFQGDVGAERVVAMSDGRVAILIAPRPGAEARLVILDGNKATTHALTFEGLSQRQRATLRRGLWMQGAYEVAPGVVGVWVEAGGPVMGLHIGLDGKVRAGPTQTTPGVILLSGRFGLVWRYGGEGLETTDGGLTWKEFDVPAARPGKPSTTRGCSAAGCAVQGWLRVGWGKPADPGELSDPDESLSSSLPFHRPLPFAFECAPTGRASPPPVAPLPTGARPARYRSAGRVRLVGRLDSHHWIPFGPFSPPALGSDQTGVSGGRDYGDLRFRAYAWGPAAADWSRAGRWMVVFDDPYDPVGMPVRTTPSVPPWSDPTVATVHINAVRSAVVDSGGRSAVLGWCPGPNQCQVFGVTEGQPATEFLFQGPQMLPLISSVVRNQDGWFLLSGQGSMSAVIHVVDALGRVRLLGTYPRARANQHDKVQLVRRARGSGVALWVVTYTAQGQARWVAVPIDPSTGELLTVQDMGPVDLDGRTPPYCAPGQDGWLVDLQPPVAPRLRLPNGTAFGGSTRIRLRVDGDQTCIEGITARARQEEIGFGRHREWVADNQARSIPLAVWDSGGNRKYEMVCSASGSAER